MTVANTPALPAKLNLETAGDYLGLTADQRYIVISQQFPDWLLKEPIEFPPHHPTYGWACRINGCGGNIPYCETQLICNSHAREFNLFKADQVSFEDFILNAAPSLSNRLGWALSRSSGCTVCGDIREARSRGYCLTHYQSLISAQKRSLTESNWMRNQVPLPSLPQCEVPRCVHDGTGTVSADPAKLRICPSHLSQWNIFHRIGNESKDMDSWDKWLNTMNVVHSITPVKSRGEVTLAKLPIELQNEIRYALHRHMKTARRAQWRPSDLQKVVDAIALQGINSLDHIADTVCLENAQFSTVPRILRDLPVAARSLAVTSEKAKEAGWFDPILVGGAAFTGTQGEENRRKKWDLTAVSQIWLRDLLWDHLRDQSLKPAGKRPSSTTMRNRIIGIAILSYILWQNRTDGGHIPSRLTGNDARTVKDTWDMWFREQIPIPISVRSNATKNKYGPLTERSRHYYMRGINTVFQKSRETGRLPAGINSFVFSLPKYPTPTQNPRPRPLNYEDFQLMVSSKSIRSLEELDINDIGIADIWLTHAFQGGRISETFKLRLGCIGLIGDGQPYIWRDITKNGLIDYGMPCYLPVFQCLLKRQTKTRKKLRARYAAQIKELDERGQARLETSWDRQMPLFPRLSSNPDLVVEVTHSWFRRLWMQWFESLGLSGVTTHQTRATLATSLLNNGAPAELVRQLLGHISHEALAHYGRYADETVARHLQQVWAAGPGMNKPGSILLRPLDVKTSDGGGSAASARIDLSVVPVEHGLCRYGPVVGGSQCPWGKNCTDGVQGPCEHFVLTGADLGYWERKRDAAYHFAEGAPTPETRDYILSQWQPWEAVINGLRDALSELGLLKEAEDLDLRSPAHDYFNPVFTTGWHPTDLNTTTSQKADTASVAGR